MIQSRTTNGDKGKAGGRLLDMAFFILKMNDNREGDLSPKFPPALRGVFGVKSLALGRHLVHRLSLQEFHWRQVAQC